MKSSTKKESSKQVFSRQIVKIVSDLVVAIHQQTGLSLCGPLNLLLVFDGLQSGILFVKSLVNRFEFATIHN
jgi:hypothetical protein